MNEIWAALKFTTLATALLLSLILWSLHPRPTFEMASLTEQKMKKLKVIKSIAVNSPDFGSRNNRTEVGTKFRDFRDLLR